MTATASGNGEQAGYAIDHEEEWLRLMRRKHRGDSDFLGRFEKALPILRRDPYGLAEPRIIPLQEPWRGYYRYKHGRCRIIYEILDGRRLVRLRRAEPRDEMTYKQRRCHSPTAQARKALAGGGPR